MKAKLHLGKTNQKKKLAKVKKERKKIHGLWISFNVGISLLDLWNKHRGKVFNSRSRELSQTITNLQVHIEKYSDKLRECVYSLARC